MDITPSFQVGDVGSIPIYRSTNIFIIMNYSDEYKIVWLTPVRTAARVSRTLMENLNFSYSGHTLGIPKGKEDYDVLFNIRNPYSRMVSTFMLFSAHQNNFNREFISFVKAYKVLENAYQLSLDKIISGLPTTNISYIRTEFLDNDLKSVQKLKNEFINMGDSYNNVVLDNQYTNEFETLIGGQRRPWQSFYTQEIADKVLSLTENQFNLFNYNKDYWKDGTP